MLEPTKVAAIAVQSVQKYPGAYVFSAEAREELSRHLPLLRYLQTPSPEHFQRLQTLASKQETAHKLLYLLRVPYAGKLPEPGEALINIMRSVKAKRAAKTLHPSASQRC